MPRYVLSKFNLLSGLLSYDDSSNLYTYDKNTDLLGWWKFDTDASLVAGVGVLPTTVNEVSGTPDILYALSSTTPAISNITPEDKKWLQNYSNNFDGSDDSGVIDNPSDSSLSFVGSGVDKPFSISVWINPILITDSVAHIYRIFDKRSSSYYEYSFYLYDSNGDGSASPRLKLYSAGSTPASSGNWILGYNGSASRIRYDLHKDKWYHLVVTYDGSASANGINVYVDGVSDTTPDSLGSYATGWPTSANIYVGNGYAAGSPYKGDMASLSIWGTELSSDDVSALYYAGINGPFGVRSGILSLPNRVRLRETDSITGSYPTQLRTTGFPGSLKGNGSLIFDDTKTQIFLNTTASIFPLVQTQENFKQSQSIKLDSFT